MKNAQGVRQPSLQDLGPGDTLYKDASMCNKQLHQTGYQLRPTGVRAATAGAAPTARELRDNDYSYVREMLPATSTDGQTISHQHQPLGPIYQTQHIKTSNTGQSAQAPSQFRPSGSPGDPYGFDCTDPALNSSGIQGTDTRPIGLDEGQHIYESPDGMNDYNTITGKHFDGEGKNCAPKFSV